MFAVRSFYQLSDQEDSDAEDGPSNARNSDADEGNLNLPGSGKIQTGSNIYQRVKNLRYVLLGFGGAYFFNFLVHNTFDPIALYFYKAID